MRTDRVIDRERTGTLWVEVVSPGFMSEKYVASSVSGQRCTFVVHISLRALDYTQQTVNGDIC